MMLYFSMIIEDRGVITFIKHCKSYSKNPWILPFLSFSSLAFFPVALLKCISSFVS